MEDNSMRCPFCNGEVTYLMRLGGEQTPTQKEMFLITCEGCGACSGAYFTQEDATEAWKMRGGKIHEKSKN